MERKEVNNTFYDELGSKWYDAYDHPIAILRAENKARAPWVASKISAHFKGEKCAILDIGCGGGFLSNDLATRGHKVAGIDLSEESLQVARAQDSTKTASYSYANGCDIPFPPKQFDVVCAMDLLEHVEEPRQVISEAARLLKDNGLFFFHTFNRTWLSWLFALKGLEWFVPNAPKNIHLYRLFIKPQQLTQYCADHSLAITEIFGLMPTFDSAFFKLIFQRKITESFSFKKISSLQCGYMGCATKKAVALTTTEKGKIKRISKC